VFVAKRRINDVECAVALLESLDDERQQELITLVDVVGQHDDVAMDLAARQTSWCRPLAQWRETASSRIRVALSNARPRLGVTEPICL